MDPLDIVNAFTVANFFTVGGGVAFVTLLLVLARQFYSLSPRETQAVQAILALAWGALAVALGGGDGGYQSRILAVFLNVLVIIAIQTYGYELLKNARQAPGGAATLPDPSLDFANVLAALLPALITHLTPVVVAAAQAAPAPAPVVLPPPEVPAPEAATTKLPTLVVPGDEPATAPLLVPVAVPPPVEDPKAGLR